jgi:hypothetical protein
MINYTTPIVLTIINFIICYDLIKSYLRFKELKLHSVLTRKLFELSRLLLIANTFALVTGIMDYFIFHSTTADVLQFGRFADRYVMYFAYKILSDFSVDDLRRENLF